MCCFFQKTIFLLSLKLLSLLLFSCESGAKLHVEPYAGLSLIYTSESPSVSGVSDLVKNQYWTGPNMGIRLGYSSLGLAVGGDLTIGRWNALGKNQDKTLTPILPGLFVSYKLPLLFKLYAVGIPYGPTTLGSNAGKKNCQGRGGKLGFSWLSFPFLSLNLEYMPLHFGGKNCSTWSHTASIYASLSF